MVQTHFRGPLHAPNKEGYCSRLHSPGFKQPTRTVTTLHYPEAYRLLVACPGLSFTLFSKGSKNTDQEEERLKEPEFEENCCKTMHSGCGQTIMPTTAVAACTRASRAQASQHSNMMWVDLKVSLTHLRVFRSRWLLGKKGHFF